MDSKTGLPAGWKWVRLGEVCEIFSGTSAPQDEKYFENGRYPFVRVSDLGAIGRTTNLIEVKDYINELCLKELNMVKASKGTILFPKSGAAITTNNRAILGIDAFIVSHLAAVKPKENIAETHFVYYWLYLTDMVQYMDNMGYPSLKLLTISSIQIPLPSLPEQKRIAAKLQEMMQEIDQARTACEMQLEAAKSLPSAYLREVFESSEAKKWEKKKLGEVCEILGGDPAPQNEMYFVKGTTPFVRMQDLGRYHKTDNLTETVDKVNQLAIEQLKLTMFPKGSILLPRSGSVYTNHRAVLGVEACVVSHIAVLKCKEHVDSYYVYYYLCNFDMNQISSFTTGLDLITFKDLKEVQALLPPLPEQKRIVSYLKEKIDRAEKLRASIEKQLETINTLPQSILNKAFNGDL